MDSFESIIEKLLKQEGYWTRIGYKVLINPKQKAEIGIPSMPRPEIDILTYKPQENELIWVECKSFLDSPGVAANDILGRHEKNAKRYKLFTNKEFREIISSQLKVQGYKDGLCLENPSVKFCLVAGKIKKGDKEEIKTHFDLQGWILFDDEWIINGLEKFAERGYENDEAIMVAKMFSRKGENNE